MALKPWWQIAVPEKNIRKGEIDESIFVAKLGDVINNRGAIDYRDPILFFKRTYLTEGLSNLLKNVNQRLLGKGGASVIRVETPFGGGKTHSLIAVYHLYRNAEKLEKSDLVKELKKIAGQVPKVRIAAIDGEELDVIRGRKCDGITIKTLWGEILFQLGGKQAYEKIREHDEKRICPGKEVLFPILKELQPFVILMDEFIHYLVKTQAFDKEEETNLTDSTLSFLQHLSEVVSSLKRSVMIVSLPASTIEAPAELLEKTKRYLGRVETIKTPVKGEEIYEIIRRRLFETVGDEKEHERVAEEFFELYLSLGNDVPKRVREIKYKKKIVRAFPFHPETIDVLMDKWGPHYKFQRTRGALRLLAWVVADLFKRDPSPLILPCNINLGNPSIAEELIKCIGDEFRGAITLDIEKNAVDVDNELGEFAKYGLAKGIATSIFIHTGIGEGKRGVTLPLIRVCVLVNKEVNPLIGDVISRLTRNLWYLYFEGDFYWFSAQPNINKIHIDKKETIRDEEVRNKIFSLIKENVGRDLEVALWPEEPKDVPDIPKISMVILPIERCWPEKTTREFVENILENYAATFRKFKNALIFLAADKNNVGQLKESVRDFLAFKKIDEDASLKMTLSDEQRKMLKTRLEETKEKSVQMLYECYRHILIPSAEGISHFDLGTRAYLIAEKLSEKVKKFLEDNQELLPQIDPLLLLKGFSTEAEEKGMCNLQELYQNFLKWKQLPMLGGEKALTESVKSGVSQGFFGLGIGDGKSFSKIYYAEDVDQSISVGEGFWIIKKEKLPELGIKVEIPTEIEIERPVIEEELIEEEMKPLPQHLFKSVWIRAEVPWDKFPEIFAGVVRPLRKDVRGNETDLKIILEIEAKSTGGIRPETIDMKVEETLKQIKAKYQIEKEE